MRQAKPVARRTGRSQKKAKGRRLATLTPQEDKVWVAYFTHYVDIEGKSDEEADRLAWHDLCREFPRLGAKP